MGIPKFFRYISERYPLTSQLIQENKIPEFDNLYLDFNGIIHNCSHPNDDDAHFRLSEEQIFTSIFAYVDHLFGKIKPKKLFFIAVDGVAPRAKMNQQRSRRFRTAKDAQELRERALAKGEKLPDEKAFDSNCITPGTPFMTRLSAQLKYFINKKVTEDSNWRDVQVVLSGHEVPGEGEHKIMEYIRLSRAQPDYNPNVRHCLYGLDADLIMLGLLSHDPHFCLLREEVKFGPTKKKGSSSLESINFYLLHLSLMREYLDLEFRDIEPVLKFPYSLERVIDDFILLAVFVGNDFLPNLPDLHIHENGLERLFDVYKKVLPSLEGYINESGVIDTARLQVVLDEMALWEEEIFEKEYSDMNWLKGKLSKHSKEPEISKQQSQRVLTKSQRKIFDRVKEFVLSSRILPPKTRRLEALTMPNTFPARDRTFIADLAEDLHLDTTWDEYGEQDQNLLTWRFYGADSFNEADDQTFNEEVIEKGDRDEEWEDVDDEETDDEESRVAVDRVLRKYEKATVFDEESGGGFDARHARSVNEKMNEWKRDYYREKLEISFDDPKQMGDLMFRYVEGLQWVMHYYYGGVASWGWFYDYHYAPRISDLRDVNKMRFSFDLGKPFFPFEQLMGVLPVASKDHIPLSYQDLMYDANSPILDFYPTDFVLDLNGKKAEWEAIVKIPFIDEKRLLKAMKSREHRLTSEERKRNSYGTSTKFRYDPGEPTVYPSSLPGFFPPLYRCTCVMEAFDLPILDGLHLVPGLCDGVFLGSKALAGFPSLSTLPHSAQLGYHSINVHGSDSRNKSMVVHIENPHEEQKTEKIAKRFIGKRIFVGWPFLQEAKVVAVSDDLFKYENMVVIPGGPEKVIPNPHHPHAIGHWKAKADRIEHFYSKKCGVITGPVDVLLHVRPLKGLKHLDDGSFIKDYEGQEKESEHAIQMTLSEVESEDPRYKEKPAPPLSEEFLKDDKIFFLGEHAYGVAAQISDTTDTTLSVILAFFPSDKMENEKFKDVASNRRSIYYLPSFKAAEVLQMSGRDLSKITSSYMVITSDGQKTNLGLSIKFEAKSLKVIDYSKKDGRFWEFSQKAVDLIRDYKTKYPEVFADLGGGGDAMAHATDIFPGSNSDAKVKEVQSWLKFKGVRDFEPVSLFTDALGKETVSQIEKLADEINSSRSQTALKKAIVKGIPRQAVLKPAHAAYRLQNQRYDLGDRVTMVQDSGGVPLCAKGVVIGLNAKSIDVVWDVPFMSGVTLGDRCSQYRGSTVEFASCLNLSNPQFVMSMKQNAPAPPALPYYKPRIGPHPVVQPAPGQAAASGFRPASNQPMQIMQNPSRGLGGDVNGQRGRTGPPNRRTPYGEALASNGVPFSEVGTQSPPPGRGFARGETPFNSGRGAFRGGSNDRGRSRGWFRGRGRGRGHMSPLPS